MKALYYYLLNAGYRSLAPSKVSRTCKVLIEKGLLKEDEVECRYPDIMGGKRNYPDIYITDDAYDRLLKFAENGGIHKIRRKNIGEPKKNSAPPPEFVPEPAPPAPPAPVAEKHTITTDEMKYYTFCAGIVEKIMRTDDVVNVRQVAKICELNGKDMTERKLFEWLRTEGLIEDCGDVKNMPTAKALKSGFLSFTEHVIETNGKKVHVSFTPKVTGKGQIYILDKICGTGEWLPF